MLGRYYDEVMSDNPLGFWMFAERLGNYAYSEVNEYQASIVNVDSANRLGYTEFVNDMPGGVNIADTNQYIELPLTASYNEFTVEVTFKLSLYKNSATLVSHREYFASTQQSFPFSISVGSSGLVSAAFDTGTDWNTDLVLASPSAIPLMTRTHVAVSRDNTGLCKLLVNGSVVDSATLPGTLSNYTGNWRLGMSDEYGGGVGLSSFFGKLGAFGINNVALSDARIAAHAIAAVQNYTVSGVVTESSVLTNFYIRAYRANDGKLVGEIIAQNGAYSLPVSVPDPVFVSITPIIDAKWSANTDVESGLFIVATDPIGTPHIFECTTGGATGATEPTWNLSGTTADGSVVWTYVGPFPTVQTNCQGPLIPTPV